MNDFRSGGLGKFAVDLADVAIEACLDKVRTRLGMALVSLMLFLIFGLIGVALLFVLAYVALAKAYDPTVAVFSLFAVCVFVCIGTLVVHKLSLNALRRKRFYQRAVEKEASKETQKLPPELFLGTEAGRLAQSFFGKNLSATLITSLLIGAAVGYMPKTSFRIISTLAGLKRFRR